MASTALTGTQQNFVRLAIAVVDKIKLPMKDLLEIYIKPCDLYNKIRLCPALLLGKHKLSEEQKDLCYVSPPYIPDYAKFDVSLLYKLIQNLCKKVVTTKGWGKEPESGDNLIGDDIERLRRIRNEIYGHLKSSSIPDVMFESQWKELEDIMKRMCTFLNSNGSNPVNYERELADVKRCDCGSNHMDQYKLMLRLLEPNKELPTISVRGETTIMCGKTVRFEVDIKHSSTSTQNWPITWHRLKGNISEQIDTSAEKYRNSTCCQLMINGASKEDQGDYQAIISGTPNERHIKIHSNVLSLKVFGEEPDLQELEVTSDEWDEIILRYRYEVSQGSPKANLIQWTRNDQVLKVDQEKYVGGDLTDNFLTITSPSIHDSGEYTCTVFNAAGSASRSFTLGVPKVKIQAESVCYGNNALITSVVSSCPPAAKAVWEKSSLSDENKFETITDSDPKYFYNSSDPRGPILNVTAATFDDKLYYRLRITNCIGESVSDRALLNVTGDRPNIFSNHETKANSCSVILTCDVFLYGKSPPITKIAWQKDGKVINATTGKYTGGTELNPALVIHNVNKFDAGSYQCKVTNEVGSTLGNVICLDVPKIEIKEQRNEANDRLEFTAVLNSIPEPIHAQWSIKSENNHGFTPIDVNREEYKGTSNNIPKPVLCIKHVPLQNRIFQIEVQNFIGTTKMQIPGERKPCSQEKMSYPKVVNGLTEIFRKNGTSIRFSDLLIDLIKEISDEELVSLKRIATVTSSMKLSEGYGKTVDDFFTYLLKKDIFNERNVIMIQYLMRRIQRLQLELKCIEYAKNEKENLCYFEETKPAEDGKTHVKLHVNDNIEQFTNMDSLLATVAAIANCERSSIEIVGLRPASSFIIVISMKEDSAKRLRQKSPHELVALMMYKVDWIEIENEPIYIPRSKGQTYGKRKHAERDFLTDENKRCRRASLGNTMELPFKSDPCKSNTGAELEEMDFSDDEDVLVDTSNVNIPKEVLKWDYDARGRNVACAKKGTQTMHRARAMIVGCAGAGKTTFLRRLQQRNIQELRQIQSTVGLEVFENLFEVDREHKSLRGLEKDVDTENKCLLSVVDFAGQCAYYACHQVYLSRRAFYLLVINMSKSFDEKVDQELCEQEGTMFADWTFGQYVLFWLKSIHTYCEDNTPVVTVATHSDEVQDMVNKSIYDDLLELLKYEPDLRKHLDRERCFHIGLPEDDNEPLDKLTDTVECIASIALEDRWRDTIPKEWSLCEVVLRQNKQNGKKIISVTDFRKQVSIKKFGKGNETFDVLRFYHDIGAILYYNENHLKDRAITDVQWFVDCFKNIITDPKHVRDLVENDKDWKNFFESGYLTQGLLKGIWKK
ncbi:uncharacterized protein LOC134256696 [Saccostrea cucullata]|uniref:uncharacterized protein LOC134256696 n=1 Tax=Saccostrea cuccullata TaxID=36930 RepID=UPI002ED5069A